MASTGGLGLHRLHTHWGWPGHLHEAVDLRRVATWVATAASVPESHDRHETCSWDSGGGGEGTTIRHAATPCHWGPRGCQSRGGMGWAATSALGGWPLVRSPSVDKSAVSRYSRSAFGPVPLSRSDAHGIGRGGHYQGRHLPFHQGPATHTPRDERTELVSFHRSAKAPHAPPYPARRTVGLDRSLAINRGKTTDVQDKGSCGLGGVCLLTGQAEDLPPRPLGLMRGIPRPISLLFRATRQPPDPCRPP